MNLLIGAYCIAVIIIALKLLWSDLLNGRSFYDWWMK